MRKRAAAAGSALFFLLAPGVVAGVVPWLITGWDAHRMPALGRLAGGALVVAGAGVLVHAFVRFVVGGLYRHVRNPMYVAIAAVVAGQAGLLGQPVLLAYGAGFVAVVWSFVRFYEEPGPRLRPCRP